MAQPEDPKKAALVAWLFSAHAVAVRRRLYRLTGSASEAAELAQEAHLRMLQIKDIDAIRNPESYLFRIAVNLAHEYAERKRRAMSTLDVNDPTVEAELAELPSFGAQLDAAERMRRLREVLSELPAKCQLVVALYYREELKYAEIAQRVGISTHMVKKYLSQALVHCRRRMARWR